MWCRREIIRPSKRRADGKGQRRLFTFRDVIEVRTLKALTAQGVRLSALKESVERLRKDLGVNGENALASTRLVTDGKTVFRYVPSQNHLESLDAFGQFAFAFGVGDEISTLLEKVGQLNRYSRYARRSANRSAVPQGRRKIG